MSAMTAKITKLFDQDYDKLKKQCCQNGFLFKDDHFDVSKMYPKCEVKRPGELCKTPFFFENKISRLDAQQGDLGDCWMVSVVAILAQHPKLFERVVPLDQSFDNNYAGIFRFRFWQYGKWVEVVVDDQLLVENGELKFARSTKHDEFWVALLEKAYAKLYGSYEKLKGGYPGDAMEDFTGGITEEFILEKPPEHLFDIMNKAHVRGSLLASCIYGSGKEAITKEGLVKGHAYSITKVHYVEHPSITGKARLLRIKNPWANEIEWKGNWSDGSPQWKSIPDEEKVEIGLVFDNDGEFWMAYEDFVPRFSTADICHLTLESLALFEDGQTPNWEITKIEGSFGDKKKHIIKVSNADGSDEPCYVVVALMQKSDDNSESLHVKKYITCLIYDNETHTQLEPDPLENTREVVQRHKLRPGKYYIVPVSDQGDQGDYVLHVFTEHPHHVETKHQIPFCGFTLSFN